MPRSLIAGLALALALATGIASPSFAAEGQTPKDFVVGEEMC